MYGVAPQGVRNWDCKTKSMMNSLGHLDTLPSSGNIWEHWKRRIWKLKLYCTNCTWQLWVWVWRSLPFLSCSEVYTRTASLFLFFIFSMISLHSCLLFVFYHQCFISSHWAGCAFTGGDNNFICFGYYSYIEHRYSLTPTLHQLFTNNIDNTVH